MLPALNQISDRQAKPTLIIKLATDILLDYDYTYHNANIRYHYINMILCVQSDASYLVMPGYNSRISGCYYLSDHPTNPTNPSDVNPNGLMFTKCKTL